MTEKQVHVRRETRPTGEARMVKVNRAEYDKQVAALMERLEGEGGHLHVIARLEQGGQVKVSMAGVVPYESPTGPRTSTFHAQVAVEDTAELQAALEKLLTEYAQRLMVRARMAAAESLIVSARDAEPDADDWLVVTGRED